MPERSARPDGRPSPCPRDLAADRLEHRSVWSRVGYFSTHGRRARGAQPGEQDRRLDLRARDRQLVVIPCSSEPTIAIGAWPSVVSSVRAHQASGLDDAPIGRSDSDSSPTSSKRPAWNARIPHDEAHERAGVAAVDRPGRRARARAGRRRARRACRRPPRRTSDAERPRRRRSPTRCRPSPAAARDPALAVASAPSSSGALRDAFRPGTPICPSIIAARLNPHRAPPRRRPRSPGSSSSAAARRASVSPVTSSVTVPPRSGEMCSSSKSSMLIRSAPSACVMPANTPGRSGTWTLHAVERRRRRCRRSRASGGGSAPPRRSSAARNAGVALHERGLDLLDPAPEVGELRPDGLGVVEEDVDPHPRVRAGDPGHVAQGSAGARQRIVPLDATRPGAVHDHVREHVRQVARQGDEPVVRRRVDRDRERAELGDEAVDEAMPRRVGLRRRRQEPGGAFEQSGRGALGAVCLRARRSDAHRRSAATLRRRQRRSPSSSRRR